MNIKNPSLIGLLWSIIISVCLLLFLILLVQFTALTEYTLPALTYAIHMFSLLSGALVAGARTERRGWLYGMLTGLTYMIGVIIVGSILFSNITLNIDSLIQIVIGSLIGAIGGIIGVNFNNLI